ncbi:uncharacterized protein BP5553_03997 [Venustampulla echinocandica]|uniref:Uncharacterized protein n=1 Tax=Venustampulla echinocandica TaxID=2656787 RepID=A0A370TVV2_9HELO|nr:uncharacterized protein BP5553_03997 [Venustampulla echinocandica]RDL39657.1 hypothetical protein BP5553_03997 [Venustampulla echinocandica]
MAAHIDTTTRYHLAPRDSDDMDRESSPHEHLLSPSPANMGTRAPPFRNCKISIEPVYLPRVASTALGITIFVFFVIDGQSDYIGADIFVMLIVLLNIVVLLGRILRLRCIKSCIPFDLKFKGKKDSKVLPCLDIGLSIALLVSMHLGRATRDHPYDHLKSTVGVYIGYGMIALQVLAALPQLARWHVVLIVEGISTDPELGLSRTVLYQATPGDSMRKPTDTEQLRQSEDQSRQSTSSVDMV